MQKLFEPGEYSYAPGVYYFNVLIAIIGLLKLQLIYIFSEAILGSKQDFFPALAILISILGIVVLSFKLRGEIKRLRDKNHLSTKTLVISYFKHISAMLIISASIIFAGVFLSVLMFGQREPTQTTEMAQIQIGQIVNALSMYYNDCGKYPASLDNLVTADATCPKWGPEPYFKKAKYLIDPWGRAFIYKVFEDRFEIKTYGRDGKEGGVGKDQDLNDIK